MSYYDKLIQIIEASAEKHGKDKTLTLGHLLSILKMARRLEEEEDFHCEMEGNRHDM